MNVYAIGLYVDSELAKVRIISLPTHRRAHSAVDPLFSTSMVRQGLSGLLELASGMLSSIRMLSSIQMESRPERPAPQPALALPGARGRRTGSRKEREASEEASGRATVRTEEREARAGRKER